MFVALCELTNPSDTMTKPEIMTEYIIVILLLYSIGIHRIDGMGWLIWSTLNVLETTNCHINFNNSIFNNIDAYNN